MAKLMLIIGWIVLIINVATNGLAVVLGTRNHVGFYVLNAVAILLAAIALTMHVSEKVDGAGLTVAVPVLATLLVVLSAGWIIVVKLMS
jgi:hypothetical protein